MNNAGSDLINLSPTFRCIKIAKIINNDRIKAKISCGTSSIQILKKMNKADYRLSFNGRRINQRKFSYVA